ncbi:hypothetical protein FACS189499_07130 [Clostridia bacterium]|nr:hypothetical protein FACS189499_07130 [Clostridia bacterium]
MNAFDIFLYITVIVTIATTLSASLNWGLQGMYFFFWLSVAVSLTAIGTTITALSDGDLAVAILGLKLNYCGFPFLGTCLFMFASDYCNRPMKHWTRLPLCAIPVLVAFSSLLYSPDVSNGLLFKSVEIYPFRENIYTTSIVGGPLYYIGMFYSLLLAIFAWAVFARSMKTNGHWRISYTIMACLLICVIFAAIIFEFNNLTEVSAETYIIVYVMAGIALYFARYCPGKWHAIMGRELAIQNMNDGFILISKTGEFLDANNKACWFFPELRKLTVGKSLKGNPGIPSYLYMTETAEPAEKPAAAEHGFYEIECDGEKCFLQISITKIDSSQTIYGTSAALCVMIYDRTAQHIATEELRHLADVDSLTGLSNRRKFFSTAKREFDLCVRRHSAGSILMLDIDFFKKVNDKYGHAAGDTVLQSVSQLIENRLRRTDLCGRYGGEEFVVWLPSTDVKKSLLVAESIRRSVGDMKIMHEELLIHVTISIGIAGIDYGKPGISSIEQIIDRADHALYQAKANGRNRVIIHSEEEYLRNKRLADDSDRSMAGG